MADEFHTNGSCWWKGLSKDRLESDLAQHSNSMRSLFGWSASCADSVSIISSADDSPMVSSPADWSTNQASRLVERGDSGFRSMLQDATNVSEEPSFHMDAAMYGSPSVILQSALQNRSHIVNNYGIINSTTQELFPPHLMVRTSPDPEQPPTHTGHLQFSNNAPYWNASVKSNNIRTSYVPSSSFQQHVDHENPKNLSEAANASNRIGNEASTKRTRNETPSTLPAFKVRKEKMGDRITALQQLVSPFGKTDTASVLSEAIESIKILHEQVHVLSAPYLNNAVHMQHHRDKHQESGQEEEEEDQDLKSRGLCLVPVASTFPVAHEPTTGQLEFWTPPFGGSFR